MLNSSSHYIIVYLIFHNLFLFQCDVTRSLNRWKARSKLFIDQGRTTLIDCCGISANTCVKLCLHR